MCSILNNNNNDDDDDDDDDDVNISFHPVRELITYKRF
jgi:hypothetical protein